MRWLIAASTTAVTALPMAGTLAQGAVTVTALPMAGTLAQGADPFPHVVSIETSARTVRAYWTDCTGEPCYSPPSVHVWELDRATGNWTQGHDRARPKRWQIPNDGSAPLVDGLRLVAKAAPGAVPAYAVSPPRGGALWPLSAEPSRAERWRVTRQEPGALSWFRSGVPSFSQNIMTFAASRDAIWFGEFGDFAEPAAILRFDRASHTTTAIAEWPMSQTEALGMATTRRGLFFIGDRSTTWLAPKGIGVARYDFASHNWRVFTAANSPLPDDDAAAIAASGDSVFVATRDGIAMYDDAGDKWTVRYFAAGVRVISRKEVVPGSGYTGDDGVRQFDYASRAYIEARWRLAVRKPAENVRELAIAAAADQLSPQDTSSAFVDEGIPMAPARFIATMRQVPVAHYDSALVRGGFDLERVLADERLVALAGAAIKADSDGAVNVDAYTVGAVGRVRARQYIEVLRRAMRLDSTLWWPSAAYALAALGDSTGWAALRASVREPLEPEGPNVTAQGYRWPNLEAAERLVMLGDTGIVSVLVQQIHRQPGAALYELLHRSAPAEVWRTALTDAARDPAAVSEALSALGTMPSKEWAPDGATREAVLQVARRAFELPPDFDSATVYPPGQAPWYASEIILALNDTAAMPALISATGVEGLFIQATTTLIKLTGADSLPVPPMPTDAQRGEAQRWWRAWWASHARSYVPVSADAGIDALRRYRDRWVRSE